MGHMDIHISHALHTWRRGEFYPMLCAGPNVLTSEDDNAGAEIQDIGDVAQEMFTFKRHWRELPRLLSQLASRFDDDHFKISGCDLMEPQFLASKFDIEYGRKLTTEQMIEVDIVMHAFQELIDPAYAKEYEELLDQIRPQENSDSEDYPAYFFSCLQQIFHSLSTHAPVRAQAVLLFLAFK